MRHNPKTDGKISYNPRLTAKLVIIQDTWQNLLQPKTDSKISYNRRQMAK